MSIFENLQAERTGSRRVIMQPHKLSIDLSQEVIGGPMRSSDGVSEEYLLYAKVYTKFWANPANYHKAYDAARKSFLCQLHSGVLSKLAEIRALANEGDCDGVLVVCNELQRELGL